VVVVEEGGGDGILPTVVGYAMRGGQGKNTPHNRGGFQKIQGKKSKITIAPPLYINYEPSLINFSQHKHQEEHFAI